MRALAWVLYLTIRIAILAGDNPGGFNFHFAQSGGGPNDDQANGVAVDPFGQIHVAGYFQGNAYFSDESSVESTGLFDVFTCLYDKNGNLIWVRSAGGINSDAALAVAADKLGNTLIAGYLQAGAVFGALSVETVGGNDAFVAKYNPVGDLMWVRTMASDGDDRAYGIATDNSGNVFVTGHFQEGAEFDGTILTNRGGVDIFLAKYAADGAFLWAHSAGGPNSDSGYGLAVDFDGNAIVCGYHGQGSIFGEVSLPVVGKSDVFVAKFDPAGSLLWARTAGGLDQDYANGLAIDSDGSVVVTGTFRGEASFGMTNLLGTGNRTFTARYDPNGLLEWVRAAGGIDSRAVALQDGQAFVLGHFVGTTWFATNQLVSGGGFDMFLAHYNREGELKWVRSFGGTNFDYGQALAVDERQSCFLAGRFGGIVNFDSINVSSQGAGDALIARLAPSPLLALQPEGRTLSPGDHWTFSTKALGTAPLSYQWRYGETQILSGATNSTLVLSYLQHFQSGLYSVVVTNLYGNVTSAPVFLNVFGLPIPRVQVNGVLGAEFNLTNYSSAEITLSEEEPNTSIFYTLDGSAPTFASTPYSGPFIVTQFVRLRVIAYDQALVSSQTEPIPIAFHLGPPLITVQGLSGTKLSFTNVGQLTIAILPILPETQIYYTLDGTVPTTNSAIYHEPLLVNKSSTVLALATHLTRTQALSDPVQIHLVTAYTVDVPPDPDGGVDLHPPGGVYQGDTVVQFSAQPKPGWVFLRWGGDLEGTNAQVSVKLIRSLVVNPVFGTHLTITNRGPGRIQVEPNLPAYARGSVIRATAIPESGYFFALWGGVISNSINPVWFAVTSSVPTLSAQFSPLGANNSSLTVMTIGRGSVNYSPNLTVYPNDTQVLIEAVPEVGEEFLGWCRDATSLITPLSVVVRGNLMITALFSGSNEIFLRTPAVSNNMFTFVYTGRIGNGYVAQATTNFLHWSIVNEFTNSLGQETILVPIIPGSKHYYRVLQK